MNGRIILLLLLDPEISTDWFKICRAVNISKMNKTASAVIKNYQPPPPPPPEPPLDDPLPEEPEPLLLDPDLELEPDDPLLVLVLTDDERQDSLKRFTFSQSPLTKASDTAPVVSRYWAKVFAQVLPTPKARTYGSNFSK